jgi:hypothetical protein
MSSDSNAPLFPTQQARALTSVLDEIIPPSEDGRLPGAGALGLVSAIEDAVRKSPDLEPAIVQGLTALQEIAAAAGVSEFGALDREQRVTALNQIATTQPAFLPGLIFHAYCAYYQSGEVMLGLGLEARPPHPLGYSVAPSDPSLLDPVRARPKLYREV